MLTKGQGKDIFIFIITVITGGLLLLPIFLFSTDAIMAITLKFPQDKQDALVILCIASLIFIHLCITSWIATGNPHLVSILFRIICLSGVIFGVSLIIDRNFVVTKLKSLEIDFLTIIIYDDFFIYMQNNPLKFILTSLAFGFLSELNSVVKNKNQVIIENVLDREMVRSIISQEMLYLYKKNNNKDNSQTQK